MIRIQARKSELQAESWRYGPKVGDTAGQNPRKSEPNRPEKGPEWGLGAFTENPLKAFLNPPKEFCTNFGPKKPFPALMSGESPLAH